MNIRMVWAVVNNTAMNIHMFNYTRNQKWIFMATVLKTLDLTSFFSRACTV